MRDNNLHQTYGSDFNSPDAYGTTEDQAVLQNLTSNIKEAHTKVIHL
jgi:hypothetical protein